MRALFVTPSPQTHPTHRQAWTRARRDDSLPFDAGWARIPLRRPNKVVQEQRHLPQILLQLRDDVKVGRAIRPSHADTAGLEHQWQCRVYSMATDKVP